MKYDMKCVKFTKFGAGIISLIIGIVCLIKGIKVGPYWAIAAGVLFIAIDVEE